MSEYWKSTPSYWCKFCSTYVKDTGIERRNHEASGRHQNNIQRSLRKLHKDKEHEDREKQRAKNEVARLNELVSGQPVQRPTTTAPPPPPPPRPAASASILPTPQQRKAHAEQLAALGVSLPEDLQKEVTGVGSYHVISERTIESAPGAGTANRSLAEILAEARRENSSANEAVAPKVEGQDDEAEDEDDEVGRKRKFEDESDDEPRPKRKNWGTDRKHYPDPTMDAQGTSDLDALLSGIKKKELEVKTEDGEAVKKEEESEGKPLAAVPEANTTEPPPAVVFKKRKGKK